MRGRLVTRLFLLLVATIVVSPTMARAQAQSAIAGVVKDTTGAVMPGVTVEASSPVLIEKVRSVVTDNAGQYKVVDLRPGTYTVTFTLPGFTTVKRDEFQLEANFTANVNAELKVGELTETVTVSGGSPVVDVQTTQKRAVLNRELLESLPTGDRSVTTNSIPAVSRSVDVGGSNQMAHNGMNAYGLIGQQEVMVDGMSVVSGRGSPGYYANIDVVEESVYTAGGTAEATTGGVTVNMIPRQGGNKLSGNIIGIFGNTSTQGSNYDDGLKARGLTQPQALDKQWDFNASVGGPILADRLWFFASFRDWAVNNYIADSFNKDGSQVKEGNNIFAGTGRLTYQISPRNKFTAFYDRAQKTLSNDGIAAGISPEASRTRTVPMPIVVQGKYTSTVSNKLLVEVGFSELVENQWLKYQKTVKEATCFVAFALCPAGTSYGDIAKQDITLGTSYGAAPGGNELLQIPAFRIVSSVSYVTGSHNLKTGIQYTWGFQSRQEQLLNGDLIQLYRNGVPDSVQIQNTPNWSVALDSGTRTDLDYDVGLYAQDSWTRGRLTINPGVRIDLLANSFPEQNVLAGRFVGERHFAAVKDVLKWKDVSPRIGAAYDLFGDGTTAIKGSFGKFVQLEQSTTALRYNPLVLSTDSRTWRDLNGDDIAQENEIGPSTNNAFGTRRNVNPDPNLLRPYTWLSNLGVQRQMWSGASLSATYYRRDFERIFITQNLAIPVSETTYTLLNIPDPRGNGQMVQVYNLNPAFRGLLNELDTNSDSAKQTYNGVDVSFTARFGHGGTATVGTSTGRVVSLTCQVSDPNGAVVTGFVTRSLRFCDQSQYSIPFQTTFKAIANYPMPFGIRLAGVFQSNPGAERPTNYVVNRTAIPNLTQTSVTVQLNEPGSQYYGRINQLDISAGREFRISGNLRLTPKINLYNALNRNPVLTEITTFGSSLGRVQAVLPPRILQLNALLRW